MARRSFHFLILPVMRKRPIRIPTPMTIKIFITVSPFKSYKKYYIICGSPLQWRVYAKTAQALNIYHKPVLFLS